MRSITRFLLLTLLGMTATVGVAHSQVIFEPVVPIGAVDPATGGRFEGLGDEPSLGPAGVAFWSMSCTSPTCSEFFISLYRTGFAGSESLVNELTAMPTPGDGLFQYFSDPRQSGETVVFQGGGGSGCPPGPCGVYTIDNSLIGAVAEVGDATPTGGTYQLAQRPRMRDGVLVFHAYVNNGGSYEWEIHADMGGLQVVIDADTLIPGTSEPFYYVLEPDTAKGRIVFTAQRQNYTHALYQYDAGVVTTLVDETTPVPGETWTIVDARSPVVTGHVLAFQGTNSEDTSALFADFGTGPRIIAEVGASVPDTDRTIAAIFDPAISGEDLFFVVEDDWYQEHLLMYRNGQLERLLGAGSQLDGLEIAGVSMGSNAAYDRNVAFTVVFSSLRYPYAIYVLRIADAGVMMSDIADASGDGRPDVATVIPDLEAGTSSVHITNPVTGSTLAEVAISEGEAMGMAILPHFAAASSDEMAVLLMREDASPVTETRDCLTGTWIRNQAFFDSEWIARGMVTLPDLDDAGDFPEVGVLARKPSTGEISVQIRDGATGAFIRNLFFLNANWSPIKAVVIPDLAEPATGVPEVGVLARNDSSGQIVVMMKDAGSNTFVGNVFFLNANWTPRDVIVLEEYPGVDNAVLALLASHNTTGKIVTMIKDPATNDFLINLFHLGSNWTPVGMGEAADTIGGTPEVTVLGIHSLYNLVVAQSKDSASNTFVANARPLSSAWLPVRMVTLGDVDGIAGDELAVLGIRRDDGKLVVQTIGAQSGTIIANAFLN